MKQAKLLGLFPGIFLLALLLGAGNSSEPTGSTASADVVIVGAGGAGMTAAIEARAAGASVIVLEKSASVGGNTLATQSGINAVGSDLQKAAGVTYTVDQFVQTQTNPHARPDLVRTLAKNSAAAISWLQGLGVQFTLQPTRSPAGHQPVGQDSSGVIVVNALDQGVRQSGASVVLNTTATDLVVEDGRVVGVRAKTKAGDLLTVKAGAVVLATGGYGQNSALVAQHNPGLAGAITDEIAPTTGEGLAMAQAVGAAAVDLDLFTTFPAVEAKTHQMIFPMYLPSNAIFVDQTGRRFVAEGFDDPKTNAAILKRGLVWAVFDQKHLDKAPGLQSLVKYGVAAQGASVNQLAAAMKVPADALGGTVKEWNQAVASGKDAAFGRTQGMARGIVQGPYYAISLGVGVHYCLGGLVISPETQVLSTQGKAIPGLFAAGEVTGGVHGTTKVDGSTFADTIIYGRIAGQKAAAWAKSQGPHLLVLPPSPRAAEPQVAGNFPNGVWEGSGAGRGGDIRVRVTVRDRSIRDVEILSLDETPAKVQALKDELIPSIIQKQSVEVDAVSGATLSSEGVLEAVDAALRAAH